MNRRTFIQNLFAFFAGATLIESKASANNEGKTSSNILKTFDEHCHYVGSGFNIWVSKDHRWHILADSHHAPHEFSSEENARNYAKIFFKDDMYKTPYAFSSISNNDNYFVIRGAPHGVSFLEYMNHSHLESMFKARDIASEIGIHLNENEFRNLCFASESYFSTVSSQTVAEQMNSNSNEARIILIIAEMLYAKRSDEAAFVWQNVLKNYEMKKSAIHLQNSKTFCKIIEDMFSYFRSYNANLAVISLFYPLRQTIRLHPPLLREI